MSQSLLSYLQGQLSGDVLSHVSSLLGEPPAQTSTAASAGVQALLGAMAQKAMTPQGASDLVALIDRVPTTVPGGIAGLLAGGSTIEDVLKYGAPLATAVLGSQQAGVANWLATTAGIGKGSASSLLGLLTPLLLNGLGMYLASSGSSVTAAAISSLFARQAPSLFGSAPAGLASALGASSLAGLTRGPHATPHLVDQPTDGGLGFLKWLLPLLAIAALIAYMLNRSPAAEDAARILGDNAATAAGAAATATSNAAASGAAAVKDAAASLGAMVERALPNLPSIRVPENGVESKLLAFITDGSRPVDTTTWFSFDRLEFDTASATLRSSSNDQLDAIAAILNGYPDVNLKIGGYTDDVGDDAANLRLSAERAETTMKALVARGIAAGRLTSEGYGEQFPVAANDTEDGRQRNRRIDLRVTRK